MSYTAISIPEELHSDIKEFISFKKLGYSSAAEFVKDAVRRRMDEIRSTLMADCAACTTTFSLVDGQGSHLGLVCPECAAKFRADGEVPV